MLHVVEIVRLGQRGEGVAPGPVYIPDALPGEQVRVEIEGERGRVVERLRSSPDRIDPICDYFGTCGGCAVQSLAPEPYAAWKRGLLVTALSMARVDAPVEPLALAHGAGRRRATFHARAGKAVNLLAERPPAVGFMQARSHDILNIAACPILAPGLDGALPAARALAAVLQPLGKPLDILATATLSGLDVDLRGCGPLPEPIVQAVVAIAGEHDIARVSNHGETIIELKAPMIAIGRAGLRLPAKSFLQATEAGEERLAAEVLAGLGKSRRVLDLFAGVGTFALRLAEQATVHAVDLEAPPLRALARAAADTAGLRPVTVETRDLFRQPVTAGDLADFDAVVFDPPRAGAEAQAHALAASVVPNVVAVSCNPATFARDAAILLGGGYRIERIVPVDQFAYSSHLEVVGFFRRAATKARRRRSLLA